MKRILILSAVLVALLSLAPAVQAETCTATGCTWSVSYKESVPTPLGQVLQLTKCTLYEQVGTGTPAKIDYPASGPNGGATITNPRTVPQAAGQNVTVTWRVSCSNAVGESPLSAAATRVKDRTGEPVNPPAAPAAPTAD